VPRRPEEEATTTRRDMVMLDDMDRHRLVIDRVRGRAAWVRGCAC
jgi:hypothetical protein